MSTPRSSTLLFRQLLRDDETDGTTAVPAIAAVTLIAIQAAVEAALSVAAASLAILAASAQVVTAVVASGHFAQVTRWAC